MSQKGSHPFNGQDRACSTAVAARQKMQKMMIFAIFISLSGCSNIDDWWTCRLASGHEKIVFETKIEASPNDILEKMKILANKERLLFGQQEVDIRYLGIQKTRNEIELCNRNTQVLADNFETEHIFRIYIRSPSSKLNEDTKNMIGYFTGAKVLKLR
ncbi:hypothetical protein [Sphingorhabdus sp.]